MRHAEELTHRVLVIDQDRSTTVALGLACLERGVGVLMAENVCEGVRALMMEPVSLIVVDAALLRLKPWEHAAMFERVAPGVPVTVVSSVDMSLDARVGFELAGFLVAARPLTADDLLEQAEAS